MVILDRTKMIQFSKKVKSEVEGTEN